MSFVFVSGAQVADSASGLSIKLLSSPEMTHSSFEVKTGVAGFTISADFDFDVKPTRIKIDLRDFNDYLATHGRLDGEQNSLLLEEIIAGITLLLRLKMRSSEAELTFVRRTRAFQPKDQATADTFILPKPRLVTVPHQA